MSEDVPSPIDLQTLKDAHEWECTALKVRPWRTEFFELLAAEISIHELRHERYAPALHAEVLKLLPRGGLYLMCDHFVGTGAMTNTELYMTKEEHTAAIQGCGLSALEEIKCFDTLVMYRATKNGS